MSPSFSWLSILKMVVVTLPVTSLQNNFNYPASQYKLSYCKSQKNSLPHFH